ncbi:MAG TPA: 4-alpha-glucanotransferase, partial [Candidatus Limnocylindria bacterium]
MASPREGASDPIVERWTDAWRRPRRISPATRAAILRAMRPDPGAGVDVAVARRGERLPAGAQLVLEDGTDLGSPVRIGPAVPHGYHRLRLADGGERLLLLAPRRCFLPARLREWGWALQLYALRSAGSWGIGDLRDLARFSAAGAGAAFAVVNPLGAPNPGPSPEPSPYYPSSRRFRSPLYLAISEVPGFAAAGAELPTLAARGEALNAERLIDRRTVLELKLRALELIWNAGGGALPEAVAGVRALRERRGASLDRWARFALLTERHGPGWQSWPAELRDPGSRAVAAAVSAQPDRVAFHAWIQWLLDEQLRRAAASGLRLVMDLPIGFDPGGFDAWDWQDQLADARLGAPPDVFNPSGQDWGLPPFAPERLRQAGYGPLVETVRASMEHAGGLRIDHDLGFFRQWWVPAGSSPGDGAYIRQPTDELLAVLAIESERAGALVIGEDLGTVEAGVRRRLAAASILSTRLAIFERRAPGRWPRNALGAVTTHDLPTVAGIITGADLQDQVRAGLVPD